MTDVVSFSAQDKWLWLNKPWLHLDKESTCSPGASWPMDQIHSTMWIFILSFINSSLPGSPSTPTPFFPSILSQKTLITLQSYQGTPDSRNTAHSRGKGVSKPLFTAGRGGEQSSIHLILGAWYFCRDQRWSPLHGFSARAFWQVVAATRQTYFQNQETFLHCHCLRVSGVHSQKPFQIIKLAPKREPFGWSCADNYFRDSWKERNAAGHPSTSNHSLIMGRPCS